MELAEFLVKIIIIATLAIGILGFTLQSASFEGRVTSYDKERLAIDLAQAFASAPCLTVTENGDARKGLLDATKLDVQAELPTTCISVPGLWGAVVITNDHSWGFGPRGGVPENALEGAVTRVIPAAVRSVEGDVVPATIGVRIE
jgi:hypothetical protein